MPPVKRVGDQEGLVSSCDFPYSKFKFDKFNPVQSRVFEFYNKDCNLVIEAQTSAGKTICAEMFIWDELERRGGKALYLAPLRALAKEKIDDWTEESHGFSKKKISICTGDFRLTASRKKELEEADIILMTPEMLASRVRNYEAEKNDFLKKIGSVVVDECFEEETLVLTESGYIPIGTIIDKKMAVRVASFNHSTGELEYKRITGWKKKKLFRRWNAIYYHGGYILVTENQLVWVKGKGYIPAKKIEKGDLLYAKMDRREKQSYCVDRNREECNLRDVVGGREHCFVGKNQEICEDEIQSRVEAEGFCGVEVQEVKEIGWNPSNHKIERRMGAKNLHIYNAVIPRTERNLRHNHCRREKNNQSRLVGKNNPSSGFGGLVHGRWKPREIPDDITHGVFFAGGGGNALPLVKQCVGDGMFCCPIQKILDYKIYGGRPGRVPEDYKTLCYSEYALQSNSRNGSDILFDVWETILDEKASGNRNAEGDALREGVLLGEMDKNDQTHRRMEEASICCDLEIEDNHNFFVKNAGSRESVLAHNSHLITVPSRGDHLEVALMKFAQITLPRFVLLSATMPNVSEIADWVSYSLTGRETYLLSSKYRPCPLGIHFENYDLMGSYDETEEEKVRCAMDIVIDYPDDKFLIFAHTKRTGRLMQEALQKDGIECEFHNSDLEKEKRHDLESRFRSGKLRVLVATSGLAWGLNTPARRVIILGMHRGLTEVESYDVKQMAGRAGRPGYDTRGDVYILAPEDKVRYFIKKYENQDPITSRLLDHTGTGENKHYKTLAFHLISEIHHEYIKRRSDIKNWYGKSLAHFQAQDLDDTIVGATLDLLIKYGAVREEDGMLLVTTVGKIASMFYYSPFDVADLKRNFKYLFDKKEENNDLVVSLCLGNVDSLKTAIANKDERSEMLLYRQKVVRMFGEGEFTDGAIKSGYAYYCLMNGDVGPAISSAARTQQWDFPRLAQVLIIIDKMTGKWDKEDFLKSLQMRVAYGVRSELVPLCSVPDIGKVRAEKLWSAGIKSPKEMLEQRARIGHVLGFSDDRVKKLLDGVRLLG